MMSHKAIEKPLVLFLDAATPLFYIAINDLQKGIVANRQYDHAALKGEALLSVVKEMFDETGLDIHSIAYLCTTKGPGSLTGLRISMSILKTMAQILNIPIVCLPTLYALERSFKPKETSGEKKIMTCLTARKNSYYVRFSGNDQGYFEQISSQMFNETAKNANRCVWAKGLTPTDSCDKKTVDSVIIGLNPKIIFELCESRYLKKDYYNYIECAPEYAGKSVAERNFENKESRM